VAISYRYFTPKQIRATGNEYWHKYLDKEEKIAAAQSLGVTVNNIYQAVQIKDTDPADSLRGIPICIKLLRLRGLVFNPVPLIQQQLIKTVGPDQLDQAAPLPHR